MRAEEFVESYFDAWNHHDPKAVADHLTADGVYRDVPENIQRTHDELIVSLREFFDAFPHSYELTSEILTGDDTVAFQYRMCPLGKLRVSSSMGAIRGAEFITLHGDAALSIIDYYDIPGAVRPEQLARTPAGSNGSRKYAKSGLGNDRMLQYKVRLEDLMRSQRMYLRPNLTLPQLARAIDCSVNHLSQVINAGFGKSFFDYVNKYRVDHAKMLLDDADGQCAVLNIAFTVGFNSNSAFYAAFKKRVGMTPAQYRRARSSPGA